MSRTLHDLVLGELQQLTTKSQRDDRFDTYMKKTYNKTASLMANSCQAVAQMASTASNTGLALTKKKLSVLIFLDHNKGHLISKGNFSVFNSPKKRTWKC